MDHFPIFLRLAGQPVLVVGGGEVAARKVELLLRAEAAVTVVSPGLCATLAARAAASGIRHLPEEFQPEHLDGMRLAIAATNRHAVNAWVAHQAERRNIPVNVVDDRELSRFIMPAIVDRSPVIVAVSSGGDAPVLTRRLREKLEVLLPEGLGTLARLAGEMRATVKRRLTDASARRRFWEALFDGPLAADVVAGRVSEIEASLAQAISRAALSEKIPGEVALVGAGPGDAGLLTLRGLRALQNADVILYDRLVSDDVLNLGRRDAERIYVGKKAGDAAMSQSAINALLVKLAREGKRVCRLKGGDPFVFGRGGEELEELARNGIAFEVVPGVTAATGCAAYAGVPLTHRDYAQTLIIVTGHTRDDLESTPDWTLLAKPDQTVVFYMGLGTLDTIVRKLVSAGAASGRAAAVIVNGTRSEQRVITGTLATLSAEVAAANIQAPALLIVGEVTRLHATLQWFNKSAAQRIRNDVLAGPLASVAGLHGRLSA